MKKYGEGEGEEKNHLSVHQELPIKIRQRERIMNELAHRYKETELLQEPDLDDIYKEIDVYLDKVHVKIAPGQRKHSSDKGE